jgi:hypothetical protein
MMFQQVYAAFTQWSAQPVELIVWVIKSGRLRWKTLADIEEAESSVHFVAKQFAQWFRQCRRYLKGCVDILIFFLS